jgi:hypothetical protein
MPSLRPAVIASLALSSAAFSATLHTPAYAQTASEIAAAKQWFADGLALENQAKWAEALDRFRRAQGVKHTPQIDFHVGLCEARSGDLVNAIVDLDRAVTSAREKGATDVQQAATTELADARSRAPTLEIDAPAAKVQRVLVDGAAVATSTLGAPVPMNPGDHAVVVEFAEGRVEKHATLAEREAKKLAFDPPMAGATPLASPTPTDTAPPDATPTSPPPETPTSAPSSGSSKVLPWALVGVGGALVVGGVVFFAMRQSEISTIDQSCPTRVHCDPSLQGDASSGQTYSTLSFVLGGAGLVAAGVGAGMLLFGDSGSTSTASARVVPTAAPGGGGAMVVGRF